MEDSRAFQLWCEQHGVKVFGIEIGEGLYGRGVLAREKILEGDDQGYEAYQAFMHAPLSQQTHILPMCLSRPCSL